ncbi:DUF4418 family protein [Gardnerella greenwoodii]|jgi:hypothetical protein|uniref:DUF4418 domain-containing protein n=2 Tax=Gardnerella TaxID=2701 RepID=A0A3E1IQL2_GARVA|nr:MULTISPECIES: DUF4418 family protein [Gardnerella]MDF0753483.1 DUF4418 family protein [Gardnerella greenwoodii]PMC43201.1 DUF4418 domain-containing protein [Gardnerella greenwoodii]RFD75260.1 hypothetical protein AXE76_03505 [Gardnerella vaginalis]RIY18373.1 hypothetical protein CJI57_01105 [Bifidobacteriaceae bacterium WP012]
MKNKLFASIPSIILGILIAIAPLTFAKVCQTEGGMHMACYYTGRAALGIGLVIAVLGIVALFVKENVRIGLSIAVIVNSLLMIAVPTFLIGVCKSPMMHCASVTRPTLIVLSVLALVFAAISVYLDSKED